MNALKPGTPVRIVGGPCLGTTGTVLRGSRWSAKSATFRRGILYHVQIDGSSDPCCRCWDSDIARFNQQEKT